MTTTSAPAVPGLIASREGAQVPGFAWALLLVVVCTVLFGARVVRARRPHQWWAVLGFPAAALRVVFTWRKLTVLLDLAVPRRPAVGLLGDLMVKGTPLRPSPPRRPWDRSGFGAVGLRWWCGCTRGRCLSSSLRRLTRSRSAWRVHAVRVRSDHRGFVRLIASAWDVLDDPTPPPMPARRVLAGGGRVAGGRGTVGGRPASSAALADRRRHPVG